jgi:hypothetical protein
MKALLEAALQRQSRRDVHRLDAASREPPSNRCSGELWTIVAANVLRLAPNRKQISATILDYIGGLVRAKSRRG